MFLSCGDTLFDLFASPGDVVGGIQLGGHVGGSPLNVAVGLARLGNRAGYLCKNSTDVFGERIRAFLDANGVAPDWIVPTSRNTTLAIVQTDDAGVASYAFYVNGTADISLEQSDLPATLPSDLDVVHVASYSTAVEPGASTLLEFVRRERGERLISYDPNVRLTIEPDLDLWRERFKLFAACADVIKASDEDIAALAGRDGKAGGHGTHGEGRSGEGGAGGGKAVVSDAVIERFATDALALGPRLIVVTRGGDGAFVFAGDGQRARAPGVVVDVQDTVGAGDTFQTAMLHWLRAEGAIVDGALALDGLDLEELGVFATSAAAITCTRVGADLPTLGDIERFRASRT